MRLGYYYKNRKVLITGGAGFIGSNLAKALVGLGAKVSIVDSMMAHCGGNIFNLEDIKNRIEINLFDLRNTSKLAPLIKDKEFIFNLAGQISHVDSMKNPLTDLEINCKSHLSLLETCKKNNPGVRIVFTSTRQVYGKPTYLPVDEEHPLKPTDVNGINKMTAEYYHTLYNQIYNIKTTILRLTNTYGPRQLIKHNRQGFIGHFIKKAICGEKIKIFGDGKQLRDFNYVDDVISALLISGSADKAIGKIYNLGYGKFYSLLDFVKALNKYCDFEYETTSFPDDRKKIDIGDYYANFNKITKELRWRPEIDLEDGLKKTITYYKKYKKYYL